LMLSSPCVQAHVEAATFVAQPGVFDSKVAGS